MIDHSDSQCLLGDLEGHRRNERSRLIAWLIDQGFTQAQIREAGAVPFMLPVKRALRDDDVYISAQEIAEATGMSIDLVRGLQGALGLPRTDDPEENAVLRADASVNGTGWATSRAATMTSPRPPPVDGVIPT